MSRVGKKPITIPDTVKVDIKDHTVFVKGPKGELSQTIPFEIAVEKGDKIITLHQQTSNKKAHALHGLMRTLVANMIHGVTEGFNKELKTVGIGYRANVSGKTLNLLLGFSHPIKYEFPQGINIDVTKDNRIIVQGIDKQLVGQVAAEIRDFRRPEPYKGKGVMYVDEKIRSKVGKAGG